MITLLQLAFWGAFLLLFYSYFLYPQLLKWLVKNKKSNQELYQKEQDYPFVSVLMSVYNERRVIEEKIQCLLQLDYPEDKILIYIGSDRSTDGSNEIIEEYAGKYDRLSFFPFYERQGKPGVINQLATEALNNHTDGSEHIFLITDANVIMTPVALKKLTQHYKNEKVAIVDANMVHTGMKDESISHSENFYISSEVGLKNRESRMWGKMAGPFGGCYSIRADWFCEVPSNFLVDDFYIAMKVFEKGGHVINDLEAVCYEAVSHELTEEFRRKARISAGNFQNLVTFPHLWWPPFKQPAFVLFSHKVLRWFGPFFIGIMLISSVILAFSGMIEYKWIFSALVLGTFVLPLFDIVLNKMGVNIFLLRSVRYFLLMNVALFQGFINFLKGIKHNAWEPPKRN
jgi:cellulose synthase/poly-beta-1,6-N-acetylglucosamine synthase-like glycosyltransferase